jgi:hypothetical protein
MIATFLFSQAEDIVLFNAVDLISNLISMRNEVSLG